MGFRLTTIFLAHFDKDTIKKSLVFGAKLTAGNMLSAASWGLLPVIMLAMIPNFFELNEIWLLTFTLTYPYIETGAYIFSTLVSSVSESYSSGMMHLTQRYLDQSLRWGIMIATMLGGAFIAFSDIFITGLLPPQFLRAVSVIGLMHIWRVVDFSTRLPDQVFQGVGKTGLFTGTVAIGTAHFALRFLWRLLCVHAVVACEIPGRVAFDGALRRQAGDQRMADAHQPGSRCTRELSDPRCVRDVCVARPGAYGQLVDDRAGMPVRIATDLPVHFGIARMGRHGAGGIP
jgi:hypothetical protein